MTKKITSIILALCMIVSCFAIAGISVSAAEGDTWTVAGQPALCGAEWDPTFTDNDMALNTDNGLYELTYTEVDAGSYQFKVCKNHAWGESYGSAADNYALVLTKQADVTIQFNEDTKEITVVSDPADAIDVFTISVDTLSAVGNGEPDGGWLNDIEWNPAQNVMTEIETGVYQISFYDVQDYDNWQLKFAANGSWDSNWGMAKGDDVSKAMPTDGTWFDLTYNGDNGIVDVPDVTDEIRVTVDMTNLDVYTGAGVKAKIEFNPVDEPEVWTVAGQPALCGAEWDPTFTDNDMVLNTNNGLYELTYTAIPAGSYQFKVCKDHAWTESYGSAADNYALVLTKQADVTIQFNSSTKEITVVTDPADALDVFTIDVQTLSAVGNGEPDGGWLNDIEWNPAENVMTEVETGIYEITFTDVQDYDNWQLKFAANGSWDSNWGVAKGDDVSKAMPTDGTWFDLTYNGDNGIVNVPEPTDVKITVDMTNLDVTTGAGAKAKIEFLGEEEAVLDSDHAKINSATITYDESIALNFRVTDAIYTDLTDTYMMFDNGVDDPIKVTEFKQAGSIYYATYSNIFPQLVGDQITATLYGRYNGTLICSKPRTYSVKQYAYSRLNNANSSEVERTLLVNLLNYATTAQNLTNHNTDALCNADLTSAQQAYGTTTKPDYQNINTTVERVDTALAKITSAAGIIDNSVSVKFIFQLTGISVEDAIFDVTLGGKHQQFTSADFTAEEGTNTYSVVYSNIFPNEYSDAITIKVTDKNGTAVSNTRTYSVESYVYSQDNKTSVSQQYKDLYKDMMNYGNSVKAYGNS